MGDLNLGGSDKSKDFSRPLQLFHEEILGFISNYILCGYLCQMPSAKANFRFEVTWR